MFDLMGGGGGYSLSNSATATGAFGDQSTRSGIYTIGGLNMGGGNNQMLMYFLIGLVIYLAFFK